ncbi:MAG TPA: stage III sporulation protein AA [Methylomusa anaerophila]|uniref:Stage III sporulation protein AA AAA+ ATPase domain-containing protein n=1 Tax=Methylomusa anaerophila TaxID=1930071 RepID=A0A348APA8_9FIRM|nr:stage III sporulation protein AA [Methylomusa anaerophila]BBB92906.1 hypothetical protein MAMMFC1_03614 [Methylomusa anaerophila]HML87258.1 stage III sporulation protein AA [Methylomusa anaerophila]
MEDFRSTVKIQICSVLAPRIAEIVEKLRDNVLYKISEIRLRVGQPLLIVLDTKDIMVGLDGQPVVSLDKAYHCSNDDIKRTFQMISRNSLYALEEELRSGYVTISGGHRVGLTGQAIMENGNLKAMKHINALNFRIAREIPGNGENIIHYLLRNKKQVLNTLIISPPRCGKTTLLRDLIRLISMGVPQLNFIGVQVGIVDERSEVAACCDGVPSFDLGPRTDVLDACPKAGGMLMLIRAMSPAVIATDELGRAEDAEAVKEAVNAGVSVIASVHGYDVENIRCRPYVSQLIEEKVFHRYVVLSSRLGPGTIEKIIDGKAEQILFDGRSGSGNEVKICG